MTAALSRILKLASTVLPRGNGTADVDVQGADDAQLRDLDARVQVVDQIRGDALLFTAQNEHRFSGRDKKGVSGPARIALLRGKNVNICGKLSFLPA